MSIVERISTMLQLWFSDSLKRCSTYPSSKNRTLITHPSVEWGWTKNDPVQGSNPLKNGPYKNSPLTRTIVYYKHCCAWKEAFFMNKPQLYFGLTAWFIAQRHHSHKGTWRGENSNHTGHFKQNTQEPRFTSLRCLAQVHKISPLCSARLVTQQD